MFAPQDYFLNLLFQTLINNYKKSGLFIDTRDWKLLKFQIFGLENFCRKISMSLNIWYPGLIMAKPVWITCFFKIPTHSTLYATQFHQKFYTLQPRPFSNSHHFWLIFQRRNNNYHYCCSLPLISARPRPEPCRLYRKLVTADPKSSFAEK